eukprot:403365109
MGTVCSTKSDSSTPHHAPSLLYMNDPLLNFHEKQIKLHDQRYSILTQKYNLYVQMTSDQDNTILIDTQLRQKLLNLNVLNQHLQTQKKLVHDQLQILRHTPLKPEDFGSSQKYERDQIETYENLIVDFDKEVHELKLMWDVAVQHDYKRSIVSAKFAQRLNKIDELLPQLYQEIENQQDELDYYQAMQQIYLKNPEISTVYGNYLGLISQLHNRYTEDLKKIQETHEQVKTERTEFDKQIADPINQTADVEILIEIANNMRESILKLKSALSKSKSIGYLLHIFILLGEDFGVQNQAQVVQHLNAIILTPLLGRAQDSVISYRKALQLQKLQLADEEDIQQNQEADQEMDEIQVTIQEINQDKVQIDLDIDQFMQTIPNLENGEKINLGRLADILEAMKSLEDRVNDMIDEVYQLERDIERTKIEMDSSNAGPKIDAYFDKVDSILQQFEDTQNKLDAKYDILDTIKKQFDQKDTKLMQKIFIEGFQSCEQLFNQNEEDKLHQQIQNCEQRIVNLQNFWKDQLGSGKSISNAEDAQHLITEVEGVQKDIQDVDLSICKFNLKSTQIFPRVQSYIKNVLTQIQQILDMYVQLSRILLKYYNNLSNHEIDEKLNPFQKQFKDQIKNFQNLLAQEPLQEDLIGEASKEISKNFDKLLKKLAKMFAVIQLLDKRGRFELQWAKGNVPEAIIQGIEDENLKFLKINDTKFKITNQEDDLQKALASAQEDNGRAMALPIKLQSNIPTSSGDELQVQTIKIGQKFTTQVKIIEEQLLIKVGGAYQQFNDFVNEIMQDEVSKNYWMNSELKEHVQNMRPFAECFSANKDLLN